MAVLVAGGTGALGTAVVSELAGAGHAVTVVDRVPNPTGSESIRFVEADLMDAASAQGAVDGVEDLEAVVNLVGGFASGPLVHETDPDDFMRMVHLNLLPGFMLARAAMPRLVERGGGAYVGVSARPALRPFPGAAGYITGKAGVLAFIGSLDAEYRDKGVRSNAILPSVIDTPANRESMPNADHSKWVAPEAIAKVVRFLVSEDSAPTSGAAVPVYGRA